MKRIGSFKRTIALALVSVLSIGVLASCKSTESSSSAISEEVVSRAVSVPAEAGAYLADMEEQVKAGIEGLTLKVAYETTQVWQDILTVQGPEEGTVYAGNAKCAFVRVENVTPAVYENVIFSFSVQRKDGAAAYASIIPLNISSVKPTFILAYDENTEITDYSIEMVAENSFETQTRTLDMPKMELADIATAGMVFPGDMVSVGGVVYYYGGPERKMYEIGVEGVADGQQGFSLKAGISLVEADSIFSSAPQNTPLFTEDSIQLADPVTKEAASWPSQEGYDQTLDEIEVSQGTLMLNGILLNSQNASATVGWAKAASAVVELESDPVSQGEDGRQAEETDDILTDAVEYFLQVAFAYTGGSQPVYFMSSESYFTVQVD